MSRFDVKRIFPGENSENLAKRCFQPTIGLYSMSVFDAKRVIHQETVKILQNAVFIPKWTKTQFSRKSCIS